jgi:hypothetical protein
MASVDVFTHASEYITRTARQAAGNLPLRIEFPGVALKKASIDPMLTRRMEEFSMNNHVEMSGVQLLRILSGEISMEEFCRNYRFPTNPFKKFLMESRTIKSVRVETIPGLDDEKVTIEFGPRDAAVGPFIVPVREKEQNNGHSGASSENSDRTRVKGQE